MERNPHLLIEGCLIGCYAIGVEGRLHLHPRRVLPHAARCCEQAIEDARARRLSSGTNILGSGFDCEVYVHRGAGAYEAGEETALLESLEGKRAQPRFKPPFPAVAGLWACPTAVNNVETLCNVPLVLTRGAEWFAALGPEKNGGPKLFCVSGHVKRPGVFEAPMKVSLRELIDDYAGGMRDGHTLKAVIPGGSSVPILMPDQIDIPASFDDIAEGRLAARLGGDHGARRHHRHGVAGRQPAALLPPRVVRQVHAVPRGHRLALSAAAAAAERRGLGEGHRAAARAWPTTSTARRCAPSATRRRRRC